MEGRGGIVFSNSSSATRKKRSNTLRRPWNELQQDGSSLPSTPIPDNNVESDEGSTNGSFQGSNQVRHGGGHSTASTEAFLVPTNREHSSDMTEHRADLDENTVKKVKLKVVGSLKTRSAVSASDGASDIGLCSTKSSHASDDVRQMNQEVSNEQSTRLRATPWDTASKADSYNVKLQSNDSKTYTNQPIRKSNRISKRRVLDEELAKDDASAAKNDKGEETAKERPSKKGKKKEREPIDKPSVRSKIVKKALVLPLEASIVALLLLIMLGAFYVIHCVWAAAEAYSAPSIVLTSQSHDGLHVFDDFRESYAWLSHNTDVDDKVASWWDYGYQTTAMANRTVIVDNNTWNNTHIATVGTAMSSPEKAAWEIFNSLDVKYVLVVFGGLIGYPSDDINKFLWMVRIGGGVFPHIKEADYLRDGQYRIDSEATPTMLNCLMYKLCYYRFVETDGKGFDRVRRTEIGKKNFKLTHFEEAFTSHHWMVRIYKLKPQKNRIRGRVKKVKSKTSSKRTAKKNPWN